MGSILFYVQNLLGVGHLRRTTLVAEAVSGLGLETVIISGGVAVPGFVPNRVEIVQLPPLKAGPGGFRELYTGEDEPADEAYKAERVKLLIQQIHTLNPRIVVIESFPFGRWPLSYELLAMLEAITAREPKPIIVASIRDILQVSRRADRSQRILDVLGRYFDAVLVHGDPGFAALSETFPDYDAIRELVHYTGLVAPQSRQPDSGISSGSEVLVSIGGGAVGQRLLWTALEARPKTSLADRPWRFITGPNLPEDDFSTFSNALPGNVVVERFRKDFSSLLARACLSISMAGYNTVTEVLRAGTPAILIAYTGEGGETEQSMRAARLAERGLAVWLRDQDLAPEKLRAAIEHAAKRPTQMSHDIDLDGARKSAELLYGWSNTGAPIQPSN